MGIATDPQFERRTPQDVLILYVAVNLEKIAQRGGEGSVDERR